MCDCSGALVDASVVRDGGMTPRPILRNPNIKMAPWADDEDIDDENDEFVDALERQLRDLDVQIEQVVERCYGGKKKKGKKGR